jgi:hypothetical protein
MSYVRILGSHSFKVDKMGAGTIAAPLGASYECSEVFIQNSTENAVNILLGSSEQQLISLSPGMGFTLPVQNINDVYVKTVSSTATVVFLARS